MGVILTNTRIFVGSSIEALELARKVAAALAEIGSSPVVWDTDAFPAGSTLLERIETLADEFDGAVLLLTPDVCSARSGRTLAQPVSNIMFEYGFLSARLTRQRVVICLVDDVELPSDLHGVKVVNVSGLGYGDSQDGGCRYESSKLPINLIRELQVWVSSLPRLAAQIPPVVQLHGYSGTWRIDTHFEMWRGLQVTPPNEVFWYGFTSLFIPPNGRGGKGIMWGSAEVKWGDYRSRYEVVNEVREATVDRHGALTLRVLILRRQLAYEDGLPPDDRLVGGLPPKEFDIHLEPATEQARELRGTHHYVRGTEVHQAAVERYVRID
jgi:Predicted nucleotide-binding protein containing TIR-like domain